MSEECCGTDAGAGPQPEGVGGFWQVPAIRRALVAGMLLAIGLALDRAGAGTIAPLALAAALVVGGSTFVPATLRSLLRRRLNVGTLMTAAASGAVILGELGEAASLAFLFSVSEGLEAYALARTRRGLRALLDLTPLQAAVLRDGLLVSIAADDLVVGDRLVVRPGERVATDGRVSTGRSSLDCSAITGESMPVEVGPGDAVFAAAINGTGVIEVEVSAPTGDNSLARVVRLVEEAQRNKGAGQRLAEKVARPLVPAVFAVAIVIAAVGTVLGSPEVWIHRALVVLVAAAPCAFAISVPVTVVAAIGAATKTGVLVKGGRALEDLAGVATMAFDKTGTLTVGRPSVVEVVASPAWSRDGVLEMAAALEARSEHPLAAAILDASNAFPAVAAQVEAYPGHGVTGTVGSRRVRVGRAGFIAPQGIAESVSRLQRSGASVVLVEVDGATVGAVAVRDELRPEAAEAVAGLRDAGIRPLVMLTGDNRATAYALAARIDLDEVHAEMLPGEKAAAVEALGIRGSVAMVGDGVNDAPALAVADVGIAMGALGSDVAVETADIALMGEDLRHLPGVVAHARSSMRIVRQNLALSATILVVLVPLAATGVLGLAAVVAAHELAEVLVIANGVRAGHRPGPMIPPRRASGLPAVGADPPRTVEPTSGSAP